MSTKLSHITLMPTIKRAVNYIKRNDRWYVRYYDQGKLTRERLPKGITAEEAHAAAERRYAELSLLGAAKIPLKKHAPKVLYKPKPKRPDSMRGIVRKEIKVVRYVIVLWSRSWGQRNTIEEARAERDRLERIYAARPCPCCGGAMTATPISKRRVVARHEGCECAFDSPPLVPHKADLAWNAHAEQWAKQNPDRVVRPTPRIGKCVRKTQGRAAARAKERLRENAEYEAVYGEPPI